MSIKNWIEEKQSAWLYRVVTRAEFDPIKSTLFAELAEVAESQARIWEKQIRQQGGTLPEFHPNLRARLVARLIRLLGPRAVRPILVAMKVRGMSVYQGGRLRGGHAMPTSVGEVGSRHKGVQTGGNVRAAAFSMAAGEYVSMRSQRELFEYQIALEREELDEYPLEEQEELALIYKARGLTKEQADGVAAEIMKDREQALDTLAREELGLNPDELGSPWGAAVSSFISFAIGGSVPLLPFLFGSGPGLITAIAVVTGAALCAVGATLSLFTGKGALWSGLRMVLIGGGAGLVTFVVGRLLGSGFV